MGRRVLNVEWADVGFFAVFLATPALILWGPKPLDMLAVVFGMPLALLVGSAPRLKVGALLAVPLAVWMGLAEWIAPPGLDLAMSLVGLLAFAFVIFGGLDRVLDRLLRDRVGPPPN